MSKKHDRHEDEPDPREHEGKHDHEAEAKAAPKLAPAPVFPFTASINEPQTISLPVPPDVEVPKPGITSLDPAEVEIGGADFRLYISGTNFFADSLINFAGHNEPTTLESDGRLSTGVKPSLWGSPVTVQVTVRNGPEVSEAVDFVFTEATEPVGRSKRK